MSLEKYYFGELPLYEAAFISTQERVEIYNYLKGKNVAGFSIGAYHAIMWGCKPIADLLDTSTATYRFFMDTSPCGETMEFLSNISEEKSVFVMQQITHVLEKEGRKLKITSDAYHDHFWKDKCLAYIIDNVDCQVPKIEMMKNAIREGQMHALTRMIELGWIVQPKKRDEMIEFAEKENAFEALAWLLDYKGETADFAKEEKKKQDEMMKKLTEGLN